MPQTGSTKLLYNFEQPWLADLFLEHLRAHGIEGRSHPRPREYSALVLSNAANSVDVYVDHQNFIRAQEILQSFLKQDESEIVLGAEAPPTGNGFVKVAASNSKMVVLHSTLSIVVLPIVFLIFASLYYLRLLQQKDWKKSELFLATLFYIFGWSFHIFVVSDVWLGSVGSFLLDKF